MTQPSWKVAIIIIPSASLVAQMVKNLPAMQETWVQSLGWEDALEQEIATHSSILAWQIPIDRGAWWAKVHGVAKSQAWLNNWHIIIPILNRRKMKSKCLLKFTQLIGAGVRLSIL